MDKNKDKQPLLDALINLGATVKNEKSISCPYKENHTNGDRNHSGWIYEKDGVWRYQCAVCGCVGDYYDVTKQQIGSKKEQKKQRIYSLKEIENGEGQKYKYTNPDTGDIELVVCRDDGLGGSGKRFTQFSKGHGGYIARGLSVLPLYNRSRVRMARSVVVTEGEKCVHALHKVDIVATTKPGGANSPEKADWSPLYGKEVYLWPDNDEVGKKYMERVKDILLPHCTVYWIDPDKLQLCSKGDAFDWCEKINWDKSIAHSLYSYGELCGIEYEVWNRLNDIIKGNRVSVEFPWHQTTRLCQALIPQTTTLLCGAGGEGKSLFLSQAMIYWYESGVPFSVFQLEEDRTYHVTRALAQKTGDSMITDLEWLRGKDEIVRDIWEDNKEFQRRFGKHIWASQTEAKTHEEILKWIEDRAKDGSRIIIIDPITKIKYTKKDSYTQDEEFVDRSNKLAVQYDVSIVYVTHPTKSRNGINLDGLKGGSGFARFSQCVMWIEFCKVKTVDIRKELGTVPEEVNRILHLIKTRNGKGHGMQLGFWFDYETLKFNELGAIVK